MNNQLNTPGLEEHIAEKEQNTPNKAAVKAVIDYNDLKGIKYAKTDVFKHFGVAKRTRFECLLYNNYDDCIMILLKRTFKAKSKLYLRSRLSLWISSYNLKALMYKA